MILKNIRRVLRPFKVLVRRCVLDSGGFDQPLRSRSLCEKKVFNLGFSKTGTTTVEHALEMLGYSVAKGHWKYSYCFFLLALCVARDYDEIIKFTRSFDAFCDGPWGGGTDLYKRLVKEYPDAKFLLTVRDSERWYKSFEKQITLFDRNTETAMDSYRDEGMWGSAYWFQHVFDIEGIDGNKEKIIDAYNRYNSEVIEFFKENTIPLLVVDVTTEKDPWSVLCPFLKKAIPEEPFPHSNPTLADWETRRDAERKAVQRSLDLHYTLRNDNG